MIHRFVTGICTFAKNVDKICTNWHFQLQNVCKTDPQSDSRQKKSLLTSDGPVSEVNDDKYESFVRNKHLSLREEEIGRLKNGLTFETVVYVILVVIAISGLVVNSLVIVAIKLNRRWLFLPWLVYHLMAIMGKWTLFVKIGVSLHVVVDPYSKTY